MMNGVRTAPKIVRRQCQHTEDTAHPVVRQTVAEQSAMSTVVLDHEQAHQKSAGGNRQQERSLPAAKVDRHPGKGPQQAERQQCSCDLEEAPRVTWLAISSKNSSPGLRRGEGLDWWLRCFAFHRCRLIRKP